MARRGQDLETAVEQERMQVDTAAVDGFRQDDLADRFAVRGPQCLKRAKHRAEVDAGVRPGAVKCRHVLRRHARPDVVYVNSATALACPGAQRRLALSVERPAVLGFAFAEYLDAPRAAVLGSAKHGLHASSGLVLRVFCREDHRAVQLQIFHVHRLGALGQRRGCRYGAMQGAGHDDAPENAVIVQPRRVGWKHLRLEHHLAARRFVPRAQQRMAGAGAPPPRRLNPIPLALKRIPWQFDPASFLTGEETRERNRETRLIRSCDRLQERFVAVRQGRIVGRAQHACQNRRLSGVARHVGPHE